MLNAWEIEKLRRYYPHGGWDQAATLWENIWDLWNTGFKPIPDPAEPCPPCMENFASEAAWTAALEEFERFQAICRGLEEIQSDFDKVVDAFEEFLLAVPAEDGQDALRFPAQWLGSSIRM